MILVSCGSVGSLCAAHSASSRSAWYAPFILMWWIQGVTPATLTAVGVVRTTVYGPFQCGARESCFQSLTTPDPWAQIRQPAPQGGMAPFLVLTDLVPWFITWPSCSFCCLAPRHLFYYGRGPPTQNCLWRWAMGPWGHPESEQSRQKQVHPGAVSL